MSEAAPPRKATLGPPRIVIQVFREIEGGSGALRYWREIDRRVWEDTEYGPRIIANELNALLREADAAG